MDQKVEDLDPSRESLDLYLLSDINLEFRHTHIKDSMGNSFLERAYSGRSRHPWTRDAQQVLDALSTLYLCLFIIYILLTLVESLVKISSTLVVTTIPIVVKIFKKIASSCLP